MYFWTSKLVFAVVVTALGLSQVATATGAQAQESPLWPQCIDGNRDETPDQQISACTSIIDSGQEIPINVARAHVNRGFAHYNKRAFDEALADYNEAIRLDTKNPVAYNNRGLIYYNKNDDPRAIADYDEAIRLNPRYAKAFYNRGNVYGRDCHDRAHSMADYQKAIAIFSQYEKAQTRLQLLKAGGCSPPPTATD